jgi:hypothetical protein
MNITMNMKRLAVGLLLCVLLAAAPLTLAQDDVVEGAAAAEELPQGAGTFALLLGIGAVLAVGMYYMRGNRQADEAE